MTGKTDVVRCRYITGELKEIEIEGHTEFVTPGSVLEQRLVRVNGKPFVCKYVSRAAGARNPRLYDLLDNEIRAGARLGQSYPDRYPRELAQLVAYNIDAEEPFALLREYSGVPVAGPAARFQDAERKQFERALFRLLRLTSEAGVVHGAVTTDALRWDNGVLQLVDFESSERVGELRRPGAGAVRSPEQAAATGVVDARDDLWAAALLVRRLHLGPSVDAQPDRRHDPDRLRGLLDPVLGTTVEHRPTAAELLSRLHGDNHLPSFVDPEARFAQGRELFENVARGKAPARGQMATAGRAQSTEDSPGRRRKRFFPFLSAMLLVSVMVVASEVIA
ncbi:hypothetical protein [Lentzea sp. NPDC003310]|uniref:hypothetical protein n=1 Tax=Lentzea sp. NPDC003310 TaxID=3154447 RepID=UPI0033A0522D